MYHGNENGCNSKCTYFMALSMMLYIKRLCVQGFGYGLEGGAIFGLVGPTSLHEAVNVLHIGCCGWNLWSFSFQYLHGHPNVAGLIMEWLSVYKKLKEYHAIRKCVTRGINDGFLAVQNLRSCPAALPGYFAVISWMTTELCTSKPT